MDKDKQLLKDMFENFKNNVMSSIQDVSNSSNFPVEFLLYYEDVCIRNRLIKEVVSQYGKSQKYGQVRYEHLVITVFEIIIRELIMQKDMSVLKVNTNIIKNNISILDKNISLLMDYYHLYIAKNAVDSQRYDLQVEGDSYTFLNKEFNLNYNIQGYYEKNNVFHFKEDIDILRYIGKPINKEPIEVIYKWLERNLDTLEPNDNLGKYTVSEFLYLWSVILFIAWTTCEYKYKYVFQEFEKYIEANETDIETFFERIFDFIKESIDAREDICTEIPFIDYDDLVGFIINNTNLEREKAICIISDLIYTYEQQEYTMMQYPFISIENKIMFSGYYILKEFNVELIMKKKSEILYKSNYTLLHDNIIEPRINSKLKQALDVNKNFEVVCSSETINNGYGNKQSQIDIFIYDKIKKDIMIIEVKDHIAKIDKVDVTNQVKFEMNASRKGAIQQLDTQSKLIKLQKNLDIYLKDVKVEHINSIFLGYCETYHLGTPRFVDNLERRGIAFIPYKLLLKNNKWSSLKKMYYYFRKARYLSGISKYSYSNCEINRFGYKINIPMYEHK